MLIILDDIHAEETEGASQASRSKMLQDSILYYIIYYMLFDRLLSTGRLATPARPVIYLITTTS